MRKDLFPEDKPNGPLLIYVGRQHDGAVYELGPRTEWRLEKAFPQTTRLPSVFLGYEKTEDFERLHGRLWEQVAVMLTGLSLEQINNLGGFRICDSEEKKEWDPGVLTCR
jgi:hypothetical protein